MPISFTCPCGKKYRVGDNFAGRRAKCSACGRVLSVPEAPLPSPEAALDDLTITEKPATPRTPSRSPSRRTGEKRQSQLKIALAFGAIVTLVVVAVLLVILFWREQGQQTATLVESAAPLDPTATDGFAEDSALEPSRPDNSVPSPAPSQPNLDQLPDDGDEPSPVPERPPARRFPSLPRAMTVVPDWIGQDAPFDVTAFFEMPPPEDNAAELYLDALFEFEPPPGQQRQLVFDREETDRRRQQVRPRLDRLDEFLDQHQDDMKQLQWWNENSDQIESHLQAFESGIDKLALAQQKDQCVFETDLSFLATNPHAAAAKRATDVLMYHAIRKISRGDVDGAIQMVEMILRLCRDLRPRAQGSIQQVTVAMEEICLRVVMPAILSSSQVGLKQCDQLMELIVNHENQTVDALIEGYRAEYIVARKALHDFRHRTGEFDSQYMREQQDTAGPVENPAARLRFLLQSGHFQPLLALIENWRWNDLSPDDRRLKFDAFDAQANALTELDYGEEIAALDRCYEAIMTLTDKSSRERVQKIPEAPQALRETTVAIFLEPDTRNLPRLAIHADTMIQGTKALIALHRWLRIHGSLSPNLEMMVKEAGLPGIPNDPYADRPFLLNVGDGQAAVYSMGPDGKDDRAASQWSGDPRKLSGDVVFSLRLVRNPDAVGQDARVLFNRGVEEAKAGNYQAAVEQFTQAIRANPDYAPAYANRGYAYMLLDDLDKSLDDLNEAIRLDEELAMAYDIRSQVYAKQGLSRRARSDRNKAEELKSNSR